MNKEDNTIETEFIYEDEIEEEDHDKDEALVIKPSPNYFKTLCCTQLAILIVAVIWGFFRKIFWWNSIKFDLSLILGAGLALIFLTLSSIFFVYRKNLKFTNMKWIFESIYLPIFGHLKFYQLFVLAILSGFCEEALFRGVMLQECGIILSSILFGALHTGSKKLIFSGFWTAVMGGCLGLLYLYTNNLLSVATAHFLNNMLSFIFIYFYARKS